MNLSRRDLIRAVAATGAAAPTSGWFDRLAAHAAEQAKLGKKSTKKCILLFMQGGASHLELFDPKPANNTSVFKPISTAVSGVQVCESLPKTAQVMKDLALLRGMSTSEGSHGRARYYMHTGYRAGTGGGLVHPSLGAIASRFLGKADDDLPNFFSIGGGAFGAGYAGPSHAPVEVPNPARGIDNLKVPDSLAALDRRADLLLDLEKGFIDRVQVPAADAHRATYERTIKLMHSKKAAAFDITQESDQVRDAYGRSSFGEGCLLARRLIEAGVSFVEVSFNGWDTHRDAAGRLKTLTSQFDPAYAALIGDLKTRGLLNDTLVIWMSDFGRTPHRGKQGGRDHWPKAWTSVLAGGGVKTGQVIGKTDPKGGEVVAGKVSAVDFMATVCHALGINHDKNIMVGTRPMRVVDKGEKLVKELF